MNAKTACSVLAIIVCVLLGIIYCKCTEPIIISPLPQAFAMDIIEPYNKTADVLLPTTETIIAYIAQVFAPEGTKVIVEAINCFYSESGLRTLAYGWNPGKNGHTASDDVGVAQINSVHGMSIQDRQNYKKNIDKAYQIYKNRGWKAWYGKGCPK